MPEKLRQDIFEDLRKRAEQIVAQEGKRDARMQSEELLRLLHEIEVYQVEIELQNEELRRTSRELQASRNAYFDLFNFAPVGFMVLDNTGRIKQANTTFVELLDVDTAWLKGSNFSKYIHARDKHKFFSWFMRMTNLSDVTNPLDLRLLGKKKRMIHVRLDAKTVHDKSSHPKEWHLALTDITRRKQAEAEREKLQEQLNQAQKLESVGRLAGGVAHDYNNMLGVILGHTELALLQADENHDLYAALKEIQTAAQRSADITKQLLAFARKQTFSPSRLDLNETVESMLNMLDRLIGEDINLVWKPAARIWPVTMDPSQIDQILANLCVNARDAISGVGKIIMETGIKSFDEEYCEKHPGFMPGDFVLLAVSDNGCGMDQDTLDNLFEPFYTTKEVGKGTGLGLATVYGIVKQNNGFINVYSEPGRGSTFKIYLPRFFADEGTGKSVPQKKAVAGGAETILLVEDEPSILRMTRMMLEKKGYNVLPATTPAEAMEKAKNHSDPIHMLMTDMVMPEMNGRDLAGQVTALYPGISLLFMSGYTADVIAHKGALDDKVAFIQKPFSMTDMTKKVREVLDNASDKE